MAISTNHLFQNFRGHINKQLVVKQYGASDKAVITKFPDMSKVTASARQARCRITFKQADAYARAFIACPQRKAAYLATCEPGRRAVKVIISDLISKGISPEERIAQYVPVNAAVEPDLIQPKVTRFHRKGTPVKIAFRLERRYKEMHGPSAPSFK